MQNFMKHPIVSTVIGGIILSVITWAFGLMPTVWSFIEPKLLWLSGVLSTKINFPIWAVIIIVFACYLGKKYIVLCITRENTSQNNFKSEEIVKENSINEVALPVLSEEENKLLEYLVKKDGAVVGQDEIRRYLNMQRLKVEQILEALEKLKLVKVHENHFHGPQVVLTKLGRDHILGNKYART